MRTQKTTDKLEQRPEDLIRHLEGSHFAAETLILLGNAYLNHLGEHVDNAADVAIRCYDGALQVLNVAENRNQYPGAWAAAHVGRGTAELRARKLVEAAGDFAVVTEREVRDGSIRPIPQLLNAYAWHGRGDTIAAGIRSDAATQTIAGGAADHLQSAARYYQQAVDLLPSGDPLKAEARLDRANILYVIARVIANAFAESLFALPAEPPIVEVDAAQTAYREVLESYAKVSAPAVWAEVQRRLGELCLMRLTWLLPAQMQLPRHPSDASVAKLEPFANAKNALEMAERARDHFTAACDVFAPSYLPMSWLDAQVGLVRAQVIIARSLAPNDPGKARSLFLLCLATIDETIKQVAAPGYSPLDWVDLQLLRAQSEFGIGALGEGDAKAHYQYASKTLANVKAFLDLYGRLHDNAKSKRTALQLADAESLSADVKRAAPDL